jgi:DNA-binding transcriptional ArsR family regulator
MEPRRDVFQAIADPTRREIIHLLARESLNLNAIAEKFDVTRQAVSLHVKILTECGLITIRQQGRQRICKAKLNQLNEVSVWVEQYRQYWESKLDSLELYLEKIQKNKKNGNNKSQKRP